MLHTIQQKNKTRIIELLFILTQATNSDINARKRINSKVKNEAVSLEIQGPFEVKAKEAYLP